MQNNEIKNLIVFGDSWAAGAELSAHEKPFGYWVAQSLNIPWKNYGQEGSSLGLILYTIIKQLALIEKTDLIVVIVPPDTRWYDENEKQGFYSLQNFQRKDYFKFLNNKTLEWFRYHHAVFIYLIQKILEDVGCQYIMAHNYGQINEYQKYNLNIDYDRFLDTQSLTELLSYHPIGWKSYPEHLPMNHRYDEDGPSPSVFAGPYFTGCVSHPNESGHKLISQLLINKINTS
jgi:hypothetical protein